MAKSFLMVINTLYLLAAPAPGIPPGESKHGPKLPIVVVIAVVVVVLGLMAVLYALIRSRSRN